MSSTTSTASSSVADVAAEYADFEGVSVGKGPLELLSLIWALALYEPGYNGDDEEDDEEQEY